MSGARPGIVLCTESREPSGVGAHMLALAEVLRERYRLALACPPSPGGRRLLDRAAALGLPTLAFDRPDELPAFFERQQAGLVHLHAGIGWEGHGASRVAHASGHLVLRTEHLPYLLTDPEQQRAYTDALSHVGRVLCVSRGARRSHVEAGVPEDLLCAVPNGIPDPIRPEAADVDAVRRELGIPDGAPLVLTVGRFTEQKGYDVYLDAAPAVLEAVPGARLVWVGDGPLWEPMRAEAERRGLTDRLLLVGRRSDVPALMAAADLFALPSRFEGLPLVVLEALAAGLPTVGTRVIGTEEAILDGETGRLVPPEDPDAFAHALVDALHDDARRRRWSVHARADFERRWTSERMARGTAAVYDALLALSAVDA